MSEPNNPAARLHDILFAVYSRGRQSRNVSLRQVWADVLKVPTQDLATLFRQLAELHLLGREVHALISTHPALDPAIHLQYAERWQQLLNQSNLDVDFQPHSGSVEEVVLQPLRAAAHLLKLILPEAVVTPDDLASALTELDEAYVAVRALQMDEHVRIALLSALDAIRMGLMRYRTAGVQAFWDAWAQVVGLLVVLEQSHEVAVEVEKPELSAVKRLFGWVADKARSASNGARLGVKGIEALNTLAEGGERLRKLLGDGS